MTSQTAIISLISPIFAIFLEWKNPVSLGQLKSRATALIEEASVLASEHENFKPTLTHLIANFALGAMSASSILPTALSVAIGTIGVMLGVHNYRLWWIFSFGLAVLVLAFFLTRLAANRNFYDIKETFLGTQIRITVSDLISISIYGLNFVVIIICIIALVRG